MSLDASAGTEQAADQTETPQDGGCGCGCSCGDESAQVAGAIAAEGLDVRTLPHAARHQIIFGKLNELTVGEALVIVNDHDPRPLKYQTDSLWPDRYVWSYVDAGPTVWRVAIARVS